MSSTTLEEDTDGQSKTDQERQHYFVTDPVNCELNFSNSSPMTVDQMLSNLADR